MIPGGARYRAGQFFSALRARREAGALDEAPAEALLAPPLLDLFRRMPPEDRRHGLEALARLRARGEEDPLLLKAALLHDVGKAEAGVGLAQRVARVLLAAPLPAVWAWLSGTPTGWRRPYWAVAHHPARGAVWIETRGGPSELVALVRHHEDEAPAGWGPAQRARHASLAAVDAEC